MTVAVAFLSVIPVGNLLVPLFLPLLSPKGAVSY